MICVGCNGEATGALGLSDVPACKPCWDRFIARFDNFMTDPPVGGVAIPEGPETRIADAILEMLGAPPAKSVELPPRRAHFVSVPNRTPRRGKLRR